METDRKQLALLLAIGPMVWLADGTVDYLFFSDDSFIGTLFTDVGLHETFMRGVGAICSVSLAATYLVLTGRLKQVEKRLTIKRSMLDHGEEIAHIGSWHLDLKSNQLTWSDEAYRIFGLEPEQTEPTYDTFLAAVHPEDREMVDGNYRKSIEQQEPYDLVHRIVRPNGEIRVVHTHSQQVRGVRGNMIGSYGTLHDITSQHRAEQEQLREQREQLKLIEHLQQSLNELDGLRKLLPVCSHCKQIRDDAGNWHTLGEYIEHHLPADAQELTCPTCSSNASLPAAEI